MKTDDYPTRSWLRFPWLRILLAAFCLALTIQFLPLDQGRSTLAQPGLDQALDPSLADLPFGLQLLSYAQAATTTLQLSKSGPATANVGQEITYELRLTNTTAVTAEQVEVRDTYPANTNSPNPNAPPGWLTANNPTFAQWLTSDFLPFPGGYSIPPTTTVLLTLDIFIDSPLPNGAVISNVTYTAVASNATQVTGGPVVTTVVNAPEFSALTKIVTPTEVTPGGLLTYTLAVTNVGDFQATDVVITDTIPAHTSLQTTTPPASATMTSPGGVVSWTLSSLAVGDTALLTMVLQTDPVLTDGLSIVNQSYRAAGSNVFTPVTGLPVTATVRSQTALTITKSGPATVPAGQELTYLITVTNQASATDFARDLFVVDAMPADAVFSAAGVVGGGAAITAPAGGDSGPVTWRILTPTRLSAAESVVLTLTVRAQSPLTNGTIITNTYQVTATNFATPTTGPPVTTTVTSAPNITLTKTVSPSLAVNNQSVTYTIVITNSGNETTGVTLTDTLPVSFTTAITTWTRTVTGTDLAGQPGVVTITFVANVNDAVPGDYPNFVAASHDAVQLEIGPVATVTVNSPTDLQISKTRLGVGDVLAGELITYTLTITNAGPEALDAVVTDTFTPALAVTALVSATNVPTTACTTLANSLVCTLGSFTNTGVITLVLQSAASFSGTLTNTGQIDPAQPDARDTSREDNTSQITTTIRYPQADLQINKTTALTEVIAGELITYTLTMTNAPGSDPVGVVITDAFPTAAVANVVSCDGCVSGSGLLTWTISPFTGTTSFTVVLDTRPSFSGTLTNSFGISFTNAYSFAIETAPADNSGFITTPVRYPQADLQISKTTALTEVIAGELITYTLTMTNAPGSDPVGVVITDAFPTAAVASVVNCDGCVSGSGLLTWTISPFTGATSFTVVLDTRPSFSGTLTNSFGISFTDAYSFAIETAPADNSGSIATPVRYPQADLQISKTTAQTEVIAGELITYTLTMTSAPGSDPVGVVITDAFPTAAVDGVVSCDGCSIGAGGVSWTINPFTGTTSFTLTLDTRPTYSGALTNSFGITFTDAFSFAIETEPADNNGFVTTPVRRLAADLQIEKRRLDGSGDVFAGATLTYSLIITNAGPDPVDAVIMDSFTPGSVATVISSTSSGVSCGGSGPLVCSAPGLSGTELITLSLTSSSAFSGALVNTASITGVINNVADPNLDNNTDAVTVTVRLPVADLQVSKQQLAPQGDVIAGQSVTYTIAITNPGDPVDLILTDTFTGDSLTASVVDSTGSCSGQGGAGPVVCNFAQFTGATVVTLTLDTTTATSFTLVNTAQVTAAGLIIDSDQLNNTSVVSTVVRPRQADLQVNKVRLGSGPVTAGEAITFTMTITNAGPDTVAAGLGDFVTPAGAVGSIDDVNEPSGWSCTVGATSLSCNNSAFTGTQIFTLTLTTDAGFAGTLRNNVDINPTSATELEPGDNSDFVDLSVVQPTAPVLTLTKTALPPSGTDLLPGSVITYLLRLTNSGTASATNVVITDDLPTGVGFVDCLSNGTCAGTDLLTISAASVGVDETLTATIEVTVTATISGATIDNQATAASAETSPISSQLVSHRVITQAGPGNIYLPIILRNCCQPNLVIESFNVNTGFNPPLVTVEIANLGDASTGVGFWVDLYVNPSTQPQNLTGGDRRWQRVSNRGIAWPLGPLGAGESVTVTSQAGFDPNQTEWTQPFGPGSYSFFVFADSFDADDNGSEVEIFESNENDNQDGPIIWNLSTALGDQSAAPAGEPVQSPPRRDVGR